MTKVAVLVSGGGTNLQALIDAQSRGEIGDGRLCCVISSAAGAYALERAAKAGIETAVVDPRKYPAFADFDAALLAELQRRDIGLVVLAGYLAILGPHVLVGYENRIVNVHPSLIPSFCGKGYYGLKVHQAALDYGVKVTGATVHYVTGVVDGGKILLQKAVDVLPGDTPEALQRRVMELAEWKLLPQAVAMICNNKQAGKGRDQ